MGWLIAAIICAIEVVFGIYILFENDQGVGGAIASISVILLFVYLTSFFYKKYKTRKNQSKINKINEEDADIQELQNGLPVVQETSLFLGEDTLHYLEPATLLVTKNKVVGRTANSGSISFRVAKGVYARTGSTGGTPIYKDVTSQFYGKIAVTSERILFIHPQKGFEIKIKDISLIEPYTDGVSIQSKNKVYPLVLDKPRYLMELTKMLIK